MITLLRDILPFDLFKQMLDEGYIRSQVHPLYPELVIFNYTEAAQFDRVWNAATNVCRGLIVVLQGPNHDLSADCVVLARPFNKFHNLNTEYVPETLEVNLPNETPLVTTKLDGSMGILYEWDGQVWVATRGSFDSDQARWATEWVRKHYAADGGYHWAHRCEHPDKTMVFEIIYDQNRIVVDYDFEGLVALGLVNIATGLEVERAALEAVAHRNGFKVVKKFDKTLAECAAEDNPNEEGYVLTYSNGVKVKVKFAEYVRLHRVLTGLNPKAIWEMLSQNSGAAVDAILNDPKMPATFLEWFAGWVKQLRSKYTEIEVVSKAVFEARPKEGSRKDLALFFKQTPQYCSVLFAMLDGKDYAPIIWDRIKPKGNDTFKKDGE
jgi:RNA ligase